MEKGVATAKDGGGGDRGPREEKAKEDRKEKSGKERRREKRLQNEPQNVAGDALCTGIHSLDFAEARATELSNMVKALRSKRGSKRTFQQLPRHMRRRAMSHNVKRLPRRLREAAKKEMVKSGSSAQDSSQKSKKPSRKQQRKTRNLQEEYQRRQRKHVWLETHIWHAKRFKMSEQHGYRLAEHASDKGVRAAYRSLKYGCLLSDISYYSCLEVSGPCQIDIVSCLKPMFSTETGLTLAAKAYIGGQREGKAVVYKAGAYPHGAIGPVHFLWRAHIEEESVIRPISQLWLFSHPAMYGDLHRQVSELVADFNSHMTSTERSAGTGGQDGVPTEAQPIVIRSLKDELVRFRLIGPRSHALLMETLKPVLTIGQLDTHPKVISGPDSPPSSSSSAAKCADKVEPWWEGQDCLATHSRVLSSVYRNVKVAENPAQFGRGTVIGMTVRDPRLFTPSKKTDMVSAFYPKKAGNSIFDLKMARPKSKRVVGSGSDSEEDDTASSYESSDQEEEREEGMDFDEQEDNENEQRPSTTAHSSAPLTTLPSELAYSLIWNDTVREKVSLSKIPEHQLNELRSKQFVKSSELKAGHSRTGLIPTLLIQQSPQIQPALTLPDPRPSHASTKGSICRSSLSDVGSGWDLVLPKNWAMPFWVALIYRGARACGIRELQKCSLEALLPHFPEDYPDTGAGEESSHTLRTTLEQRYRRRPPDKRKNYGKLLISTPFHCPWQELVDGGSGIPSTERRSSLPPLGGDEQRKRERQEEPESTDDGMEATSAMPMTVATPAQGPPAGGSVGETEGDQSCGPPVPKRPRLQQPTPSGDDTSMEKRLSDARNGASNDISELAQQKQTVLDKSDAAAMDTSTSIVAKSPTSTQRYYVLRSREILRRIGQFMHSLFAQRPTANTPQSHCMVEFNKVRDDYDILQCIEDHPSALLLIKFEMFRGGNASELGTFSIPSNEDLTSLCSDSDFSGPSEVVHPKGMTVVDGETISIGVSQLSRREVKEVKRQRAQEAQARKKCRIESDTAGQSLEKAGSGTRECTSAAEDFKLTTVVSSRQTFGYATSVGSRLSSSICGGTGYCSLVGLVDVLCRCYSVPAISEPVALFRSGSIKYRFVRLALAM